jgi:hypothetical protein
MSKVTTTHVAVVEMYVTTTKNELVYIKEIIGGQILSGKTREGKIFIQDISTISVRDQHLLRNGFNIGII